MGIGDSSDYASFRAEQRQLTPIGRRVVKVHKEYCKAAKKLDSKNHHTSVNEYDPVESALLSFGPVAGKYEGTVLGLGIGCFGELPAAGPSSVYTFIACSRVVSYVDRYDDKSPKGPLECSVQESVACGVMRPFSPGATLISLACSRPPPACFRHARGEWRLRSSIP